MDNRRIWSALALSMAFFFLYQQLVLKRYARPRPDGSSASAPAAPSTPAAPSSPRPASEGPSSPLVAAPASAFAAPEGDARVVVVDTETLRLGITEAGARLVSVELKAYRRTVGSDNAALDLVDRKDILPGTLDLGNGVTDAAIRYRADRDALTVAPGSHGEVVFTGDAPGGLKVQKRFAFDGSGNLFRLAVSAAGDHVPTSAGLLMTALPKTGPQDSAVALSGRKLVEQYVKSLDSKPVDVPTARWGGFATQYFLAVAIPESEGPVRTGVLDGTAGIVVQAPLAATRAATFDVYAGPKERQTLAAANHDLGEAVNYGMFWFIALPLLEALRLLHRVTGNYGVNIIILTVMVKLVTLPLTRASFKNMREMQRIQPQMAKIRERFKDDQQEMQREMMELYKRHKVNPFAGCLPMLLQFPILLGFYSALSHAIELRHAPFALWINDLSAPDRLSVMGLGVPVLTLLMGGSMLLQTWMTPAQGDPTQQRMMMVMPLIFTFTFINMPSGLVLYWLVSNVLSVAQQYWMMRDYRPAPTG